MDTNDVSDAADSAARLGLRSPVGSTPAGLAAEVAEACGVDGAALTLFPLAVNRVMIAASTPLALYLDRLEDLFCEGPGREAVTTGTVVTASPSELDSLRWTHLGPAARALGIGLLVGIPLRSDGTVVGSIVGHSTAPPADVPVLTGVADQIGDLLLHGRAGPLLAQAWSARAPVLTALGIIAARSAVSTEDALALLRSRAYLDGATLDQVAQAVVDGDLRISRQP